MTWGLVRHGKKADEVEEKLAEVNVPGGKEVPYFVTRVSDDYEEEGEPTGAADASTNEDDLPDVSEDEPKEE